MYPKEKHIIVTQELSRTGKREIFLLHQPDTRHLDENEESTRAYLSDWPPDTYPTVAESLS